MKIIYIYALIFSSLAISSVQQGETINANKFNNSTFQIGDIKHSILTQTQFQSIHGSCWLLMDGQSMAGTHLAQLTQVSNVPDARGVFLRSLDNGKGIDPGRVIATSQTDQFKSHTHIQDPHYHNESMGYSSGGYWGRDALGVGNQFFNNGDGYTSNSNRTRTATAINQSTGGIETRPVNLSVNLFIKVHNDCN